MNLRQIKARLLSMPFAERLLENKFVKKLINRETVSYLFFGGLTTVVSLGSYAAAIQLLCDGSDPTTLQMNIANTISWVLAVAFAYITNKIWVFKSKTHGFKSLMREITAFFAARLLSFIFEEAWMNITAIIAGEYYTKLISNLCKLAAQFAVIVMNYIFSKLFIFKKEK